MSRFAGKVAVITGTGGGMGREAAIRFAAEGARVVGCDLKEEGNAETVELVRAAGGEMTEIAPLNLMVEAAVERLMATAADAYGGIDILYNNAATFRMGSIEEQSYEDFNFSLQAEISTVFLATKHAIPHFRRRGGGTIINVGSIAGQVGTSVTGNLPGAAVHCVAKAGVIRFTEVAAIELAAMNIRVNTVSPGTILTPVLATFIGENGDNELAQAFIGDGLIDRIGRPSDVVSAALFLASDEAKFITGANLNVDGGFVASGGRGRPDSSVNELMTRVLGAKP
ncbi:SDR family NAD(P)-dependent oxidoreductase [Xanthomonas axonopodis]|uniref:SDR family NAD(P)-dependent oxidoreductase n=1 Tax=Xanthomonas axonopodis TaxID=53413 RepID=UPI003557C02F